MLCNHTALHLPWRCFVMQDGDRPAPKYLMVRAEPSLQRKSHRAEQEHGQDVRSLDGSRHVMRCLLAATRAWRHATSHTLPRFPEPSGSRQSSPDWLAFDDLHRWSWQQRTHPPTRDLCLYAAGMPNASRNRASSCVDSEVRSTWN